MTSTERFEYGPQLRIGLIFLLLGIGFGAFMGYEAFNSDQGLIIAHTFHLDVGEAHIFYAVFSFLFFSLAILGGFVIAQSFSADKKFLEIDESGFNAPKALFFSAKRINFKDIVDVTERASAGIRTLEIKTDDQKATISSAFFKSRKDYDSFASIIYSEIQPS